MRREDVAEIFLEYEDLEDLLNDERLEINVEDVDYVRLWTDCGPSTQFEKRPFFDKTNAVRIGDDSASDASDEEVEKRVGIDTCRGP